jgi:hypothetical protein
MLGDGTAPGKEDVDSEVCRAGTVVTAVLTATPATIGAPRGTPPSAGWLLRDAMTRAWTVRERLKIGANAGMRLVPA